MAKVQLSMHSILTKIKNLKEELTGIRGRVSNDTPYVKFLTGSYNDQKESLSASFKSNFDSKDHKIKNLIALEAAKLISNNVTMIKVNSVEMTVTEALVQKKYIELQEQFLQDMITQLSNAKREQVIYNDNAAQALATDLNTALNQKLDVEVVNGVKALHESKSKNYILDPNNIGTIYETRAKALEKFKEELDSALQVSNAMTTVEVEYVD